jgi:molybdopterin converting factor small subunit
MKVTVTCFGAMREYLPDPRSGSTSLDVPEAGTVADVMFELGAPLQLLHTCLVNGRRVEPDQTLEEGSEVTLMPPFSGGAARK